MSQTNGKQLSRDSWIQFNAAAQEINLFLTLDVLDGTNVKTFEFILTATNSYQRSINTALEIRGEQNINAYGGWYIEFTGNENFNQKMYNVQVLTILLQRYFQYVGERNKVEVASFTRNIGLNFRIKLIYHRVDDQKKCNQTELQSIQKKLLTNQGNINSNFMFALLPESIVNHVTMTMFGACLQLPTTTPVSKAPVIMNQMQTLIVTNAGFFQFQIPSNTFFDTSDGYTRSLKLQLLDEDKSPIPLSNWITLSTNQVLLATPTRIEFPNTVTKRFNLRATNSKSFFTDLEIAVIVMTNEPKDALKLTVTGTHRMTSTTSNVDLIIYIIEKLNSYLYDQTNRKETLLVSFQRKQTTFSIVFVDSTIIGDPCKNSGYSGNSGYHAIYNKLYSTSSQLNGKLVMEFLPSVILTGVELSRKCQVIPTTTTTTTTKAKNSQPYVSESIQPVDIVFGRMVFRYISSQTFLDKEDGDTKKLQIELLHSNGDKVNSLNWLQINKSILLLYGAYTLKDFDELQATDYRYLLRATDSGGLSVTTPIVLVPPSSKMAYSFVIRTVITLFYDPSTLLINEQLLFITKMNSFLQQFLSNGIQLISFTRYVTTKEIHVQWTLDNLNDQSCPYTILNQVSDKFVTLQGQISDAYKTIMQPEYTVKEIKIIKVNPCSQVTISPSPSSTEHVLHSSTPIITTPSPPTVNIIIPPLSAKLCSVFIYYIPKNTFNSPPDSDLDIELLSQHGQQLGDESWIAYNKPGRYLYGVIIEESMKNYDTTTIVYRLKASNGGGSTFSHITIKLPAIEKKFHAVTIVFYTKTTITNYADLTTLVVGKLSNYLKRSDAVKLISVIKMQNNFWSVKFAACEIFIPYCKVSEYDQFSRMFVTNNAPNAIFKNFVYPEMELIQLYAESEICNQPTTTTKTPATIATTQKPNINLPPTILKLLPPQTATTCRPFKYTIPSDAFFDIEDGIKLQVSIKLVEDQQIPNGDVLSFDKATRTIHGALTSDEVARIDQIVYRVIATDSGGLSVFQLLTIQIIKKQEQVDGNTIDTFGTIMGNKNRNTLKEIISEKFSIFLRGKLTSSQTLDGIQIHSLIIYPTDPRQMNLKWSICQSTCNPNMDIVLKRVLLVQTIQVNSEFTVLLHPEAHLTSLAISGESKCKKITTTTQAPTPNPNTPPSVYKAIPVLTIKTCKLLDYQIPYDTCFDKEDGFTAKLSLKLLHANKTGIGIKSWIHLNEVTQKLYGILKTSDIKSSPNNVFMFYLECQDSGGLTVEQRIYIVLEGQPPEPQYNFLMKSYTYVDKQLTDSEIQLLWLKKMKRYLQQTTYDIQIVSFAKSINLYPQITIKWYQCSITDPCSNEIKQLRSSLLNEKNHHSMNEKFSQSMVPEFVLISGSFNQNNHCQPTSTTTSTAKPKTTTPSPSTNQNPITIIKDLRLKVNLCEEVIYQVPVNTFFDLEDGYTRSLDLTLTKQDGSEINDICITFDEASQTIYLRYVVDLFAERLQLKLTATDKQRASTSANVIITIEGDTKKLSHWFVLRSYVYNMIPQKLNILNSFSAKLQHFYNEKSTGHILFKRISYKDNFMEVEWANCTLYRQCNNDLIDAIKNKILMYDSSIINSKFVSYMAPSFVVTHLDMKYGDMCHPTPSSSTIQPSTSVTSTLQPSVTLPPGPNTPPKVVKEIPVFEVPLCSFFNFRIPEETFYDKEDGSTRYLRLELRQFNDQQLSETSWIQFVESTQVVYGQYRQVENKGTDDTYVSFILRAYDKSELRTFTVITLKIPNMNMIPFYIAGQFTRFFDEQTPELISQLYLTSKISIYLGEQDSSNVLAISYHRTSTYVRFGWTSCKLIKRNCHSEDVQEYIKRFVTKDDQINMEFTQAMKPYYTTLNVSVNMSNCDESPTTTIIPTPSSFFATTMSSMFTNQPPTINGVIKPISLHYCSSFSYTIPNDLFLDDEDGNTRSLKIQLFDIYGNEVNNRTSWVQYNRRLFLIYGLIKCSDVERQPKGGYQFILKATDSHGLSAFTILSFKKLEETVKVGFEVIMEIECSFSVVTPYLNDIFQIINKIALFFGDQNNENIKVVDFYEKPGTTATVIFKWTNCTFDFTQNCPSGQIAMLRQKISYEDSFAKTFEPNYRVKEIGFAYHSPCSEPTTTTAPTTTPISNPPKVVNYIPTIITKQCTRLLFTIPDKTFYDDEDGWTSNLTLALMSLNDKPLPKTDWIWLNQDTKTIEGIPAKLTNIASPFQSFIYNLAASDGNGHKTSLVIRIDVMATRPDSKVNQNFTLILRNNFPISIPDVVAYKIQLKIKIASFYGDKEPYFMEESHFEASKNSLIISWSNCTVNGPTCNKLLANLIKDKIMDNSGKCRTQFAFIFLPEFTVQQLQMDSHPDCKLNPTPPSATISPSPSTDPTPTSTSKPPTPPPTTIQVLIPKINLRVDFCEQVEYSIPENIFLDATNGNSRSFNYSLLFADQLDVTCSSWLQFNQSGNKIYGNVLSSQTVNPTTYKLKASNSKGDSATTNIQIDTTQLVTNGNVSYRAAFSFQTTFNESVCDAEVLSVFKAKLANYFQDDSTRYSTFIYFSRGTKQIPSYVMWTNCTIRTDECDFLRINYISSKLFIEKTFTPNPSLVEALKPEFTQLSVLEEKLGRCDDNEVLSVGSEFPTICVNTCGEFEYYVNTSMFVEVKDGKPGDPANNIIVEVTDREGKPIPADSWITYHQLGNHFLGFPSKETIDNEPEGGYSFLIHAFDSKGAAASVPITFKMCGGTLPDYDGSVSVKLKCNKTITQAIDIVHDTLKLLANAYYEGTLDDFFLVNYQLQLNNLNFTWTNCSGSVDFDLEQLSPLMNGSGCHPVNYTLNDHKDYPPQTIKSSLRFQVSHCHPKNYSIPHDSIVDKEDGDLRNLTVYLAYQNRKPLPYNEFIALHRNALEVIFMTTNQTRTKTIYEYFLIAKDKMNQTAEILLYFEVMDDYPEINFHVFTQLRAQEDLPVVQNINMYFEEINRYTKTNNTWLAVDYKGFPNKTLFISYTICGLTYPKCDHSKIDALKNSLQTEKSTISSNLATALFPRFTVQKINVFESGDCLLEPNTAPKAHRKSLNVTVSRCGITRYHIPEDTWLDEQSGNTRNLSLKVYGEQSCWWNFNKTKQEITFLYDPKIIESTTQLIIGAIDSRGESSNTTLTITFESKTKTSYQLVFLFDIITPFSSCFDEKLYLLETFIQFFNQREKLTLVAVSKGPEMMEVVFEHCEMRPEPCNFLIIDRLMEALMDGNTLKDSFVKSFSPTRYTPRFLSQRKAEACFDRSNSKPKANGTLNEFTVTMCYNQSQWILPRDLVTDAEDGNWLNMKKTLYQTSITTKTRVINSPWIELLQDSLELTYIQSVADSQPAKGYTFVIEVTDSRGSKVEVPFKVFLEKVEESKRNITFSVESTFEVDNRINRAATLRKWKDVVETKLSMAVGISNILVQNSNNLTIEWTKCGQDPKICPYNDLDRIEESNTNQTWNITKYGRCLEPPSKPPNGSDITIVFDPCLKINYTIPDTLFTDDKDGGSSNLKITAIQSYPREKATFIEYHELHQQFLGIVLLGFFDKYNSLDFLIEATDSEGMKANASLRFVAKNMTRQYEFKTRTVYFGNQQSVTGFATEFCIRFEAYLRELNLDKGVMIYNATKVPSSAFTYDITVTPCAMTGKVCDRPTANSIIKKLIDPPIQPTSGFVRAMLDKIVPETVRLYNTSACTKEPWNYGNRTTVLKAGICTKQTYTWKDFLQNVANSTMISFENLQPWMIFNQTNKQLMLRPTLRELQSQPTGGYTLFYQISDEDMIIPPKQNLSVVVDGQVDDYNFMLILHLTVETESQESMLMNIQRRLDVLTKGTRFKHTTVVRLDGNQTTSIIKAYLYDCNLDLRFCNIIPNQELTSIFIDDSNTVRENISSVFEPEYNITNITTLTSGKCLDMPEDEPYVTAEIPPIKLSMCGKVQYKIPRGLFVDKRDGIIEGRNIQLCDVKGVSVDTTASLFIRYVPEQSLIQVMLTREQLEIFNGKILVYYLKANNSLGNTANTSLILQLPPVPQSNLLIKTQVLVPSDRTITDFDVLLEICQRIEHHLRKENVSISVVSFKRDTKKGTSTLEWTTCDLINKNCSKSEIDRILKTVFSSEAKVYNPFFIHALGRGFGYTHIASSERRLNYCLYPDGNTPPSTRKNTTIFIELCGYFERTLDNNTFVDEENGDISNLTLSMRLENGSSIPSTYWIQYNDKTKAIYGIVNDDVRLEEKTKFVFLLQAKDDSDAVIDGFVYAYLNESASKVHLDQDKGVTKLECKTNQPTSLDTLVMVLEAISAKINSSLSDVYLKRFFKNETTLIVEWISCSHLNLTSSKELIGSDIKDCTVVDVDVLPKPRPTITTTTKAPKTRISEDVINIRCGYPAEYKIKEDVFNDNDNVTSKLTLEVLDSFERQMNYTYMSFNRSTQIITTFISTNDCSETKVNESFTLKAFDEDGNSVASTFSVRKIPKTISCCVYIQMQIDPLKTPKDTVTFYRKLKSIYPNNSNSELVLVDVYRHQTKDVVLFTNGSITNETCSNQNIKLLTDPVFVDENNTQIEPALEKTLKDYSATDIQDITNSDCKKTPIIQPEPVTSFQKADFFFTPHWYWYLLPLFILAFMLLVCCLCYYCCRSCYNCCLSKTPKDAGLLANETRFSPSPLPYSTLPKEIPFSDKDSLDAFSRPIVGPGPGSDKIIALPTSQMESELKPVAKPRHVERRPVRSSVIHEEFVDAQEEELKIDFNQRFDNIDNSGNSSQRKVSRSRITSNSMNLSSKETVAQRLATSRPVTTSYIAGTAVQQTQANQQLMQQQQNIRSAHTTNGDRRVERTRGVDTRRNLRLPAIPTGPPPPYSPPRFQRIIRQKILPNYYERYLRHNRKHRGGGGRDSVIIPITEEELSQTIPRRISSRVLISPPKPKQTISIPIKMRRKKEIKRIVTPVITIPETPTESISESISEDSESIEVKAIIKGKQHSIRRLLLQSPMDGTTPLVRKKKKRPKRSITEIPAQYSSKIKRRYSVPSPIAKTTTKDTSSKKKSSSSKFKHKFARPYLYDYVPVKRSSIRKRRYWAPSNKDQSKNYSTLSRATRKKLPTLEELLDDSLDINDKVDLEGIIKKPSDSLRRKRTKLKDDSKGSWIDLKDIKLKE